MVTNRIDAAMFQRAFLAAAKRLEAKKEWINELNVFPVPDGDTGTNMTLTIMSAAKEVAGLEQPDLKTLAKAVSSGSLRGARGNSGVILSQLLRGFTKEIQEAGQIDPQILSRAMVRGTETAYKAVMKPKEGTILTVARGMSEKGAELAEQTEDILEMIRGVIEAGEEALRQTPELLPVLKEAGVVDSGGQGLMEAVKGAFDGLTGKEMDLSIEEARPVVRAAAQTASGEEIRFGYCTEFIINLEKEFSEEEELKLKDYFSSIGDCVVVVSDDEIVKVHVHTNHPGLAFEKGLTYGSLSRMKVDNMREEHEERLIQGAEKVAAKQAAERRTEPAPKEKDYGFVAVSSGEGLGEIFYGIGADLIIEGGQTMNPSTEDLLNAVAKVPARTIFILPNNKNIIMAAQQAAGLTKEKNVIVIPSKTIPQGITALVNFMPDLPAQENTENMIREMGHVKTIQVTYAVRSTVIDGKEIHEGDRIGIGDQGLLAVGTTAEETALASLKELVDDDSELITIYAGGSVSEEEAGQLAQLVKQQFQAVEVDLQQGDQPVYDYLLSIE